jgi:hypothetical protein
MQVMWSALVLDEPKKNKKQKHCVDPAPRLRSTHPGGSNRLDFVKLASVDNENAVPHPRAGAYTRSHFSST